MHLICYVFRRKTLYALKKCTFIYFHMIKCFQAENHMPEEVCPEFIVNNVSWSSRPWIIYHDH